MMEELLKLLKEQRKLLNSKSYVQDVNKYYKENYISIERVSFYQEVFKNIKMMMKLFQSSLEPSRILQKENYCLEKLMRLTEEKLSDRYLIELQDHYEKLDDAQYCELIAFEKEMNEIYDDFRKEQNQKFEGLDWSSLKEKKLIKYKEWKEYFNTKDTIGEEIWRKYQFLLRKKESIQNEKKEIKRRIQELESLPHEHHFYTEHCFLTETERVIIEKCLICNKEIMEIQKGSNLTPLRTYRDKDRIFLLEKVVKSEITLKLVPKNQK